MNFQSLFIKGRQGLNKGLSTGIKALDKAIGGIQRKAIYGIAAAPKVGKTTLADFAFVLSPYLEAVKNNTLDEVEWLYWSFEIDRVKKEFKYASFFFYYDHKVSHFVHKGKQYKMSSDYLMGKKIDDDGELIRVSEEHTELIKRIYVERIIPLFGEYDTNGKQIKKGKITFIEEKDNPTGLRNFLINIAKQKGQFIQENYNTLDDRGVRVTRQRITGWKANEANSNLTFIILTDHIRKLKPERNYTRKENIDKWIEYQVELRNWCGWTFIDICHTNRNMSSVERMKFSGEFLYPTGDDLKDTGNLSEDADVLMTMFDPNDEKYQLEKHFGYELEGYPNYRSIHIVESRDTECPIHIQTNMFGGINYFEDI